MFQQTTVKVDRKNGIGCLKRRSNKNGFKFKKQNAIWGKE